MMGEVGGHLNLREEIGQGVADVGEAISASLRPLPTASGDGTYLPKVAKTGVLDDLAHMKLGDAGTLAEMAKIAATGELIDDKRYIMERVIQLASSLPSTSRNGMALTGDLLAQLWNDLQHPPISQLGSEYMYRTADGSNNNIWRPDVGAAGMRYARSVQPRSIQPINLPDPGVLFDSLMARERFEPHPSQISSMLFYLATIIVHDLFKTDSKDHTISNTSSYLDLSPLYGTNQEEQDSIRTFKDGKLKPDSFTERRVHGLPPGSGLLLVMFNRFHNHVVQNLASINEGGRFSKPRKGNEAEYAKYDNDLFQTGRLITCGLYINCILKDYVRTILNINRIDSDWSLDPRSEHAKPFLGTTVASATGNQISAEFNLIYRWHSCLSERDAEWTENMFKRLFPGRDPEKIPMEEFLRVLAAWSATLPADPQDRGLGGLKRGPDGLFDDDELVQMLTERIEDCAGAFGAKGVPRILKQVEILGIIQARSWNLSSLNEFRKHFHLKPHETFDDINSDPYIADQLRHLYDHPDNVELYPGVVVEQTKEVVVPGSGLCTNFTISRAILSDAVALVRGDRFYTVDYTPRSLTNWGLNECNYDVNVNKGQVFYKLILRAFPRHFKTNSVYAHFPLVTPAENLKILSHLGIARKYSWDKPREVPLPIPISSHSACRKILGNKHDFKVTWGETIEFLMKRDGRPYGRDFMLSGDRPANAASRKLMHGALYIDRWREEVMTFYKETTLKLLHSKAYKLAGTINQVDIVRDVINMVHVHFCAAVFSLPLKTEENPRGVYTEKELYNVMALVFTSIFFNVDPAKSFALLDKSRAETQKLGRLVLTNVELISRTGFLAPLIDRIDRHDNVLADYGIHMIERLLDTGLPPQDIVWTHVLPTAGGMVANQGQLFSQCLDYYLSDDGSMHLPEIHRLSKLDTPEADDVLLRYVLEGARMRSVVALYRDVTKETKIQDGDKVLHLRPGQRTMCNLVTASMDPTVFPNPTEVDLTRDLGSYIHFGYGPHKCLGFDLCNLSLTTMLKVIDKLENLRRTPGPQGELKKVSVHEGLTLYMPEDQSRYLPFPSSMKVRWDGDLPPIRDSSTAKR
ncbi:fatty acid oxygenase [Arthroderma uncinatum]|uniref:fatty acid oxygenase n=1 Tax=Arthroderma uncinatum TaxID=74035 RepID=UPI00144A55FD|nr:fatty acid oxygenase [Arthroderma uncinatum]KAF3481341.1 fatty acid oxygenase [Arthroderma uncinatum]